MKVELFTLTAIAIAVLVALSPASSYLAQSGLTVSHRVKLGPLSPNAIAVDDRTNLVYVAQQPPNSLVIIDGNTNAIVASVSIAANLWDVAVNPVTHMVYVIGRTTAESHGVLFVLNGTTRMIVANLTVGRMPNAVEVNPGTDKVYVTNMNSTEFGGKPDSFDDTILVVDGRANREVDRIPDPYEPFDIAVNPATNMVYVSNLGSVANPTPVPILAIDGGTNLIVGAVYPGSSPFFPEFSGSRLAVNPFTDRIYASGFEFDNGNSSGLLYVIDGHSLAVLAEVAVNAGFILALSVNPVTNAIYALSASCALCYEADTVSVIDGSTKSLAANLTITVYLNDLAVDSATNTAYIAGPVFWVSVIPGLGAGPATTSSSTSVTTTPGSTRTSGSSEGGILEFPSNILPASLLVISVVGLYLMIRGRTATHMTSAT